MKKIIYAIALGLVTLSTVSAQEENFEMSFEKGFTKKVVASVPGKEASDFYRVFLGWLIDNHNDKSLSSRIDESNLDQNFVVVEFESPDLVKVNSLGKHGTKTKFKMKYQFFNGGYSCEFLEMNTLYEAQNRWTPLNLSSKDLYNKKGELRSMNKYLPEVADYFNSLNAEIRSYLDRNR